MLSKSKFLEISLFFIEIVDPKLMILELFALGIMQVVILWSALITFGVRILLDVKLKSNDLWTKFLRFNLDVSEEDPLADSDILGELQNFNKGICLVSAILLFSDISNSRLFDFSSLLITNIYYELSN